MHVRQDGPVPGLPDPLPSFEELADVARVVTVPLHVRFRGVSEREALLLKGPKGWAEFSPFPEYDAAEGARWLACAIEAGWGAWPSPVRDTVAVNATVPAVPAEQVGDVLARFDGCTTAKVKVAERGQSIDDDVARVAAVRDILGADAAVRVDANGGWTVEQAVTALSALSEYRLQYAEQPCATVADLVELRGRLERARVDVAIAADESIRRVDDPYRVAESGAVQVVVLKAAPLGGVTRLVELGRDLAQRFGVHTVVSSALETSVGLATGVAAAAALEQVEWASGLGTARLLAGDVCAEPMTPSKGELPVGRREADPQLLERWEAPAERRQWWLQRLRRCREVME